MISLHSKVLYITSLVYLLNSCVMLKTGSKAEVNKGELQVSDLETISKNDDFYHVSGGIPLLTTMKIIPSEVRGDLALDFMYNHGRFGSISGTYGYNFRLFNVADGDEPIEKLHRGEHTLTYSLPVFNMLVTKDKNVSLGQFDGNSYYTIMPVTSIRTASLRMGYGRVYTRDATDRYFDYIENKYTTPNTYVNITTFNSTIYEQSSFMAKAGASYKVFHNTTITGTGDGKDLSGQETSVLEFFFDFNILLSSKAARNYVSYEVYGSGGALQESVAGPVDMTEAFTKFPMGFSIGYKYNMLKKFKNMNVNNGFLLEIGINPGYYEKLPHGLYILYRYTYGFGNTRHR